MKRIPRRTVGLGLMAVVIATSSFGVRLLPAQPPTGLDLPPIGPTGGTLKRSMTPDGGYGSSGYVRLDSKDQAAESERAAKISELLAEFGKSENEDNRKKLADNVSILVAEQFDARQLWRDAELKELEKELARLRTLHEKRSKQKNSIVKDRTSQLLRHADGLGWNDDGAWGSAFPQSAPNPPSAFSPLQAK